MRPAWGSPGLNTRVVPASAMSLTPRLSNSAPPASVTAMTISSWTWGENSWLVKSARISSTPGSAVSPQRSQWFSG
jgi:hypothetical protein